MNKHAQPLPSRGTQFRTVRRIVDGKKVRVQEPIPATHSVALIDGALQTVKK